VTHQFLETERVGATEYLTLHRPEVRNAFNADLVRELTRWAQSMSATREVRIIVVAGHGPVFCAGADLQWMSETLAYTRDDHLREAAELAAMFRLIDELPQAVVARIHGAALGGGAGLVAVCDIAVASDETIFGFSEVKLGIVPAVISPFVLRKIGRSAARELFLTGRRFTAARAREIRLVHTVVSQPELDQAIGNVVAELMSSGPEAVTTAKRLIRNVADQPIDTAATVTIETIAERRASEEGRHGMTAFLEKRRPPWTK
jgi:methylglutaconyl-CoA hydratase